MAVRNAPAVFLALLTVFMLAMPAPAAAQPAARQDMPVAAPSPSSLIGLPVVAIHVSELTAALYSSPVASGNSQGLGVSWNYFVIYESIMESLRSDGTPFVTIGDADIRGGALLQPDGSPKYPILISLAAEVIADEELDPLRSYVQAGGFLMVGSSAFTRRPGGEPRPDFALADEMGLHMLQALGQNWYTNQVFSKEADHRLVAHIPDGKLTWNMPLSAEEVPWGTSYYGHPLHGKHLDFQVRAGDATVLASGSRFPLLAVHSYGKGTFIYHGDLQPLLGFGGSDAGMYAYGIYRNAIEWAFEEAGAPVVRLSPWPYAYDAAFILRHDLEDSAGQAIEKSAQAEFAAGAKGDYYFTTGTLRAKLKNDPAIVASLRRAVSLYGATIGPHNGGLKNPNNTSLTYANLDYWHWGPDEAIFNPAAGYDYAFRSVQIAYQDIDRWLAGVDNGRPGCGAAGDCPHIWVSPYFNSTSEESNEIMMKLSVLSMGEQKLGPFPHFTLSTRTPGLYYPQVSLPVSDWYIGSRVAQSLESGHTPATIRALVDDYYNLGALVNLYGHASSASGLTNSYMLYCLSKPHMWAANSVLISDWWEVRSGVTVEPEFYKTGAEAVVAAMLSGVTDPETALDFTIPGWRQAQPGEVQVFVNGIPAAPGSFRETSTGIKVKVGPGAGSTRVEVHYAPYPVLALASWSAPQETGRSAGRDAGLQAPVLEPAWQNSCLYAPSSARRARCK